MVGRPFEKGNRAPGSGRKRGQTNKTTEEVRKLAKEHGPHAVKRLREILDDPDTERRDQITAANSLLDRAYGKASPVLKDGDGTPVGGIKIIISGDDAKL